MRTSFALFVTVLILFSIGLLMVFNTTSAEVIGKEFALSPHLLMAKQGVFSLFGVIMAYPIYLIGYRRLIAYSFWIYLLSIFLLLLVFLPKIGMQINGAHRWINVFGVSLQPSEFVKVMIPLYYLKTLFDAKYHENFWLFCLYQTVLMIPIFLIIIEPDNGTAAILLVSLVMLYFLTRIRWTFWVIPILIVSIGAVSMAFSMKHVRDRIEVYLHPEADLLGKGHQPYQAKIAAGSGGMLGKGLGESLQKLNYLPEARSDYIAAIFAEEFGFIGILFLMTLYMVIATLGFRIAVTAKDSQGYYLATLLTFMIAFQAFLNLGVVSGILPSKGTNLPFFSQGGSSLLGNIFMLALLMSIYDGKKQVCQKPLQ